MNSVEPFKNVKQNISEINEHDKLENDPLLKQLHCTLLGLKLSDNLSWNKYYKKIKKVELL